MKAEGRRREREAGGGKPTTSQVANDHASPSDAIEFGDEHQGVVVVEVVQHLGAENEVDTAIGER
jgi:hypothetical protein